MTKYRTEKDGNQITIWDETNEVGLRFTEGEPLQRYNAAIAVADINRVGTENGVADINQVIVELTQYAERHYPKEFAPLAD